MNEAIVGLFNLPRWGAGLLTLMLIGFGAWSFNSINAVSTKEAVQEQRWLDMQKQLDRIEANQQIQENLTANAINKLTEALLAEKARDGKR